MSHPVRRFDKSDLKKSSITSQGFLKAPAYATRVGVFTYRTSDGKVVRELRPPTEVFNHDSMQTLANVPVTKLHPKPGLLDSVNAKDFTIGFTGDVVENVDDKYVQCSVTVIDSATIKDATMGLQEVSCGYHCDLDHSPGIYEGEPYDVIQKNIVYNHLAIVPRGRAGAEVKLHLDADDAVMVNGTERNKGDAAMQKIKVKDKEYDVHPELADAFNALQKDWEDMKQCHDDKVSSMQKEMDALKGAVDPSKDPDGDGDDDSKEEKEQAGSEGHKATMEALQKQKDSLQAKADSLESDLKKAREGRNDAADDRAIQARVAARLKVLAIAGRMLSRDMKLDEMSDLEIKKQVIKADSPEVVLDGKSPEYVAARFDHIEERMSHVTERRQAMGQTIVHARKDAGEPDAEAARKRMIEEAKNAYKAPIGLAAK